MSDASSAKSGGGTNSGDEELESEHQAVDDIESGEADEDQSDAASATSDPEAENEEQDKKYRFILIGVILIIAVMALIVGLAVGLPQNNDKTPATVAATSDGTDNDLNETTTSPSTAPSTSAAPVIQAGIKGVQNFLVSEGITEEEDLSRDGYLQAIQWIAEQDELSLPIPRNESRVYGVCDSIHTGVVVLCPRRSQLGISVRFPNAQGLLRLESDLCRYLWACLSIWCSVQCRRSRS
jgi:hypothetical protein